MFIFINAAATQPFNPLKKGYSFESMPVYNAS